MSVSALGTVSENGPDLFLNERQLLQVPLQERHLLLLSFAVAIANDVVVLLLDLIELNFQLDYLQMVISVRVR